MELHAVTFEQWVQKLQTKPTDFLRAQITQRGYNGAAYDAAILHLVRTRKHEEEFPPPRKRPRQPPVEEDAERVCVPKHLDAGD